MGEETPTHPEEQMRHLLGYIGEVRAVFRMQNWNVILHRTVYTEDDDTLAHTWQEHNHTCLNIELGRDFWGQTGEQIRDTVCHELIHAQHRDVTRCWEERVLYSDAFPRAVGRAYDEDFHVYMERFVSWVTQRIAATAPVYSPAGIYPETEGLALDGEQGP